MIPRTAFKKGQTPWNKGLTKETDERVRKNAEAVSRAKRGKSNPKGSEIAKRLWKDSSYREKLIRVRNKTYNSKEYKKKRSKISKELWKNPEFRRKTIEGIRRSRKNKETREKIARACLKGLFKRPTSLETKFIELCKEFNLPYSYVGDGSVMINGANPDFINNNGQKLLIETANRFHHNDTYPRQRKAIFGKFGFKVLVLWGEQFKEKNWKENIIKEVKNFGDTTH